MNHSTFQPLLLAFALKKYLPFSKANYFDLVGKNTCDFQFVFYIISFETVNINKKVKSWKNHLHCSPKIKHSKQ